MKSGLRYVLVGSSHDSDILEIDDTWPSVEDKRGELCLDLHCCESDILIEDPCDEFNKCFLISLVVDGDWIGLSNLGWRIRII